MHSTATLDKLAKIVTLSILLLMIVILYPILKGGEQNGAIVAGLIDLFLFILVGICYYYTTKGYTIHNDKLIIERPAGRKIIALENLKSVTHYSEIKGSTIRTFGNGGLFGYFGQFSNDKIGNFKMYSTKARDFYILDFGKKKIGISPDESEFIEALKGYISKQDFPQS